MSLHHRTMTTASRPGRCSGMHRACTIRARVGGREGAASVWDMLGSRRRLAIAGVLAAMLVGVALHDARVGVDLTTGGAEPVTVTLVGDHSPIGAAPSVLRGRTWNDGDLVSATRHSLLHLGGAALTFVLAMVAGTAAWWYLTRPDRRVDARLGRSTLVPLRAPPVLAAA